MSRLSAGIIGFCLGGGGCLLLALSIYHHPGALSTMRSLEPILDKLPRIGDGSISYTRRTREGMHFADRKWEKRDETKSASEAEMKEWMKEIYEVCAGQVRIEDHFSYSNASTHVLIASYTSDGLVGVIGCIARNFDGVQPPWCLVTITEQVLFGAPPVGSGDGSFEDVAMDSQRR